jgi:thioredoxin 1
MNKSLLAVGIAAVVIGAPLALKHRAAPPVKAESARAQAAAQRVPRLVDLGTTTCAPCKAMLVVMDDLERSYGNQLAVEFINVQQQEEASRKYGVRVIPTQIFLDPDGKELFRHTGFFATEAVVAKWRELGYPLTPRPTGG